MELIEFNVKNFRSVKDSHLIETKNITALIGENESGKTNILLPLWKLNPASKDSEGKMNLMSDYPRKEYNLIHNADASSELKKQHFIEAKFKLQDEEKEKVKDNLLIDVDHIFMSRDYNNKLNIILFSDEDNNILETKKSEILKECTSILKKKEELNINEDVINKIEDFQMDISIDKITVLVNALNQVENTKVKTFKENLNVLLKIEKEVSNVEQSFIFNLLPKFIYYSDYSNLDSQIYIPDVVNNNHINPLKNRTLKTLFDFVNLTPSEIYEMGHCQTQNPTDEQKKLMQDKINERQTLLESASTSFTESFNNWWGQGDYNFKFEVDGDYFRIKVSDSLRKEGIELEQRSRGLQWFFSFYLIFLVESKKSHKNSILLLDEPGVTLHPNSQKDLYLFFENLSKSNQLIYTTHSPFMINANQLDKVYAVYVDIDGKSNVTSDLRHTGNKKQDSSIYPAFAALGLNVSDTLLQGCIPVIVEGISDQIYFSLIKNSLINKNILKTNKEIVFIPSTGVKGIKSILCLLSCIESSQYPYVIIDGDSAGIELKKSLEKDIYTGCQDKIISIFDYKENYEVEDLLPREELIKVISTFLHKYPKIDDSFDDVVDEENPICDEIKKFCDSNNISMENGYKVEIAKKYKDKMLKKNINCYDLMNDDQKEFINKLFSKILGE